MVGKDFEVFWELYPKKRAKADARKAWKQMKLEGDTETVEKIIEAIKATKQHQDWQREGGQFIPLPATYLRGERWEDELEIDIEKETIRW